MDAGTKEDKPADPDNSIDFLINSLRVSITVIFGYFKRA